jgi:crotonobetainyl-CoA:carnitine CoA-transferase CaiB-like acyl-CoA transferase
MHAVFATMLALRDREASGDGHLIEVTMIEAALNAAAEQVVEHGASGTVLTRHGNRGPLAAPQNVYACEGHEEWIALAITDDDEWQRLRKLMGDPEWARDEALSTHAGRRDAHDRLDDELGTWFATRDAATTADELSEAGVPAGYVIDAREVVRNPQLEHRGYAEIEDHPVTGPKLIPMIPFRFRSRAGTGWLRTPSPTLGQHNDEILGGELGLTGDELAALVDSGQIGHRPTGL